MPLHFSTISPDRINSAYEKAAHELKSQRNEAGYWAGRLSDSALATATAVSALAVFNNTILTGHYNGKGEFRDNDTDHLTSEEITELRNQIQNGVHYLVGCQNHDGGWGDTDKSVSNLSTTLLVKSALLLSDAYDPQAEKTIRRNMDILGKSDVYIRRNGGMEGIQRRYGSDKTFAVPILTNAALAGLISWENVPQLPFERAALPMPLFRFLNLSVVSYAIPALVAIGLARFHHTKQNVFSTFLRKCAVKKTLKRIEEMQPESGGYLEAVPLTAFVVMNLVSCGMLKHPVVTRGLRFILNTVRGSGAWAIDTNLATWLTSQSFAALYQENSVENENNNKESKKGSVGADKSLNDSLSSSLNYIVANQHTKKHPFTGAKPGGWAWTNLSGGVPDADDTAGALLALAMSGENRTDMAVRGIRWLLAMQNSNGGMPTFCRGWGMLPFDQSSTDITAHTIRAFRAWLPKLQSGGKFETLIRKMRNSEKTMLRFLKRAQKADGSWIPLWFGDQFRADSENPVYGTAKVLTALEALPKDTMPQQDETVTRAVNYLLRQQNEDGGWGTKKTLSRHNVPRQEAGTSISDGITSTIEETAVVLAALAPFAEGSQTKTFIEKGLSFLLDKVETGAFTTPAPIGLYFSHLWYYENLYPILFTASALRRYLQQQ